MSECIERNAAIDACFNGWNNNAHDCAENIRKLPAADVVEEENILKFYYVRSIDEYWIGQRIDNFYYAEYDFKIRQWVWTHSRYLPWGKRVVSQTSAWEEHTYPSEPEEIPFEDWLQGFIKKVHPAADVRPVVLCKDCKMQQYCKVAQYLGKDGFCSKGEKDVRSLGKCKLYKDCEYRTIWNCCCEDCNMMEEG